MHAVTHDICTQPPGACRLNFPRALLSLPARMAVVGADAERRSLGPVELRRKAAAFALEAVDSQKEQFKRFAGSAAACSFRLS